MKAEEALNARATENLVQKMEICLGLSFQGCAADTKHFGPFKEDLKNKSSVPR